MFTTLWAESWLSLEKSKFGKPFAILMLLSALAMLTGWGELGVFAVFGMLILKIFM